MRFIWPAQTQYSATGATAVAKARATALTESPTSYVQGKTFGRFVIIFLEKTDYDSAAADPNLSYLARQSITLTNYLAVTHPSQPNYVAAVGGDTHGILSDNFSRLGKSVKTISGFKGTYVNQKTGANDYVRKHNPFMSYDSVTLNLDRLAKIKNFTMFYEDLANNALPQWMFITPKKTDDGHDTSATTAGAWARDFLTPLLRDSKFLNNTLVLLTFDETESYTSNNQVFSFLLGDAIPASSQGTSYSNSYNHYSQMATAEKNWSLGNLGLKDDSASTFF